MIKQPRNVRLIGNCLSWQRVKCATGYDVFDDGKQIATVYDNKYIIDGFKNCTVSAFVEDKDGNKASTDKVDCIEITDPKVENVDYLPDVVKNYSVVFEDNFDQGIINANKWQTRQPWGPNETTNNELQYYVDTEDPKNTNEYDPFSMTDDSLIITADNSEPSQSNNFKQFNSGLISTFETFRFKYGFIEARLKVPDDVPGFWSALWTYSADFNGSEIDLSELCGNCDYGSLTSNWQALHSGIPLTSLDPNRFTGGAVTSCQGDLYNSSNGWNLPEIIPGAYNTYGCLWRETCLIMYVNGIAVNSICDPNYIAGSEMYLIANLAVGGVLGGEPDTNKYPADLEIDYIRVLQ